MDKEILDLIRTFEEAASKMENLDRTVSGFGQVVSHLQSHLDELIEMVRLEEIVELSTVGANKLHRLKNSLEEVAAAHSKTLEQADLLSSLVQPETLAAATSRFAYEIENETVSGSDLMDQQSWQFPIAGARKLFYSDAGVFVLAPDGIYLVEGRKSHLLLEAALDDAAVDGNQLLYLAEGKLYRYHLLLKESAIVLEGAIKMEMLQPGHAAMVQAEAGKTIVSIKKSC